jgi:hypothetical protein
LADVSSRWQPGSRISECRNSVEAPPVSRLMDSRAGNVSALIPKVKGRSVPPVRARLEADTA